MYRLVKERRERVYFIVFQYQYCYYYYIMRIQRWEFQLFSKEREVKESGGSLFVRGVEEFYFWYQVNLIFDYLVVDEEVWSYYEFYFGGEDGGIELWYGEYIQSFYVFGIESCGCFDVVYGSGWVEGVGQFVCLLYMFYGFQEIFY